jgi:hypothetical protein
VKIQIAGSAPRPYTPKALKADDLPEADRPVFWMRALTVDELAEMEDSAEALSMEFTDKGAKLRPAAVRRVHLAYATIRKSLDRIDNLEGPDGPVVTAEDLVKLISQMDRQGKKLLEELYLVAGSLSHLEGDEKNG